MTAKERVRCGGWRLVDWHDQRSVPRAAGCYVIYDSTGLLYIGKSNNVRGRLAGYGLGRTRPYSLPRAIDRITGELERRYGIYVKVRIARRPGEHAMAEHRLIRRLRPPLNRQGVRQ